MSQTIETIIFDLGGVLINWDPKRLFRKIFDDEAEMDKFLSEVCTMEWNEQQDAGRSIQEATEVLVQKFPDYTEQITAYYGRWEEMLGGAIEGTVSILKQLKQQERLGIYALTNWSSETFPIALERFDFLQLFEGILVSGVEQLKKPDPKIYQLILDRYNLKAETSVFIDDSLRNIKAAAKLGIDAIHFQGPESLENELSIRNLLIKV